MSFEKIKAINTLFRKDQEKNKDSIISVTGMRGDGKSNLAMYLSIHYVKQFGLVCSQCKHEWIYTKKAVRADSSGNAIITGNLIEPCPKCKSSVVSHPTRFNFRQYMAYDNNEMEGKIRNPEELPDFSPLIGDEAVRWAFSQDFALSANKDMKKLFNQHRPRRLIQFLNIPRFNRLDSSYRELATYWIWVMQRTDRSALAMIFIQDKGSRDDPFRLKELYDIIGSYNEHTPMEVLQEKCDKVTRKHPCALDWFMIPPIPQDIYEDYQAWRNTKVFAKENETEEIDQKELAKIIAYNLIYNWPLFQGEIKRSRFEKPTHRIMEKYIYSNPQTKQPIVRYTTIRNWVKHLEKVVKA